MRHKALLLSDVLTLACVASELLVFGNAIAFAPGSDARIAYLMCAIPAVFFGLPIVIGVAAVRRARGGQMAWAGFELLGVFCLFLSRQILTGFVLPLSHQAPTPVGLLASQCFTFSIGAKAVHLVVLIGLAWRGRKIDIDPAVDVAIDSLNALSLIVQMFTIVGMAHGAGFIGPALFLVSPTAAIGTIALISAAFLRRKQMRGVILIDLYGSLCLLTTWWTLYYAHVLRMSSLERALGEPVEGLMGFDNLCLSIPFLFLILCKLILVAVAFVRRQAWTQYTLAGILIFFAACGPICFAAWRVGR
jgi:hypothetical protein